MRFSRRKPARAPEPATNGSGPARVAVEDTAAWEGPEPGAPDVTSTPTDAPPDPAPIHRAPAPTATTASGAPTVPVPAPSSAPPASTPPTGLPEVNSDTDLDRFFAALRQVVHDAREQVTESGEPRPGHEATEPMPVPGPTAAPASPVADARADATELVPARSDAVAGATPVAPAELAPTTAELIASLEADRDLWRERAVVWRERAMGADMLVKTLNAHMSDLQINLEDLRLAMRVLGNEGTDVREPRGQLPAPRPTWSGLDHFLDPGT
jgi:hypothetical protein